jgi:hypothetical protein
MAALADRRMPLARRLFVAALADSSLDERERMLSQFGLAIANGERIRAHELGREMQMLYPGDPDLAVLQREFGQEPPPRPFRRRR